MLHLEVNKQQQDMIVLFRGQNAIIKIRLFIKPGIQERGRVYRECRERGECLLGFRGMFKRIPGNVWRDSGECLKRFGRMYKKIPGNVREDSVDCWRRFRGMLKKISGNLNLDLLVKFCLFLSNSAIKLRKNKGMFSALLITT